METKNTGIRSPISRGMLANTSPRFPSNLPGPYDLLCLDHIVTPEAFDTWFGLTTLHPLTAASWTPKCRLRVPVNALARTKDLLSKSPHITSSCGSRMAMSYSSLGIWPFECTRSVLSRHSVVFRDMFELSQPTTSEQMEGIPRCTVYDGPYEMEDLLNAIYYGLR